MRRFVGGATTDDAVEATGTLVADGLTVTLDHLGEDTTDRDQADAVVARLPRTARRAATRPD